MSPITSLIPLWALRDLIRRPLESLGLLTALTLCIACLGAALVTARTLDHTAGALISQGPAAVIRKVSPLGWEPMPLEAADIAGAIPGVVEARGRVWGTVGGPEGPVTVLGADSRLLKHLGAIEPVAGPVNGEAVVGRALSVFSGDGGLHLQGMGGTRRFQVKAVLDRRTDTAAFDLVILHPADARNLLGIPEGYTSDLVIDVFHDGEAEAMRNDLSTAFPWPVRITTREETLQQYRSAFGKRAGFLTPVYIPSVLALCLIVATTLRDRIRRRGEIGLLKALGWSVSDMAFLELTRSTTLALTAGILGGCMAYGFVFGFGTSWVAAAVFGWEGRLPAFLFDPQGALLVLVQIAALLLLPFVASSLGPLLVLSASLFETSIPEKKG